MGTILYEIICCSEWKEEKEDAAPLMTLPTSPQRIISYFHPSYILKSKTMSVEEEITWMKSLGPLWQIAATCDGKIIAVLQHSFIETRSLKDNFSSVLGRNTVIKDPFPNFRCMAWSRDSSLLAVSFSNGLIVFYDIMASLMFSVKRYSLPSQEESSASIFSLDNVLSGLFFAEERVKKSTYCNELISVDNKGLIKCFRQTNADQMTFHHEGSVRRYYPRGVNLATYLEAHSLLLICGSVETESSSDDQEPCIAYGITVWRLLNDSPYYKIVINVSNNDFRLDSRGMWKLAFAALKSGPGKAQDAVFKVSVSPDGKFLAALHITGKISVWNLPSLKLFRMWHLQDQHQVNTENTRFNNRYRNAFNRSRSVPIDSWRFHPCDINWWDKESLIVSRVNGCVSICSLEEEIPSKNLLGESPELFESPVPVTCKFDRGFFALECDIRLKDERKDSVAGIGSVDALDAQESNFWIKTVALEVMFRITESETFRPPRKRKKKNPVWKESFRLYSLRSITPLELFHRKIELEEYGEALDLSRLYKLDPDLVYQRQWTRNPVSVHSIRDYLGKIQKRNWVLQECMERVPENIDAARELLQFGIKGTDLSAVVIISQGKDKGKFILWTPDDLDISQEEYMLLVDKENQEVKRILSYRKKFLFFLDMLNTYEQMLGGPIAADENFDGQVYGKLRSRSPAESAVEMAQNSDISGLRILLTNHWDEIASHYLLILSSFPETTSPHDYRDFLPEIEENGSVLLWNEVVTKEKDWCDDIMNGNNSNSSDVESTAEMVTNWYETRVREIELYCGMVNYASDLARLGLQRNVEGLHGLMDNLEILEDLVYEIKIEDITLQQLEDLSDIERIELLMSKASSETFVTHYRRFIMPFLKKCELREQGSMFYLVNQYLTSLCKDNLKNVLQIFENSKLGNSDPLISPVSDVMQLAFNCIYACTTPGQSSNILAILNCLPERNRGLLNDPLKKFHDDIDNLERHYQSVQILEKYDIFMTLKEILDLTADQENESRITDFFKNICQKAGKKSPPLKLNDWKMLLFDALELQKKTLPEYRAENCYEIYVHAVLRSGDADVINLSREFLDKTPPVVQPGDKNISKLSRSNSSAYSTTFSLYLYLIPYQQSLEMILEAATLYFDSACNYTDPDMELAKLCLNLMQNLKEEKIAIMFDLIDAVKLLNKDFQLQILPQSVRNHGDRLKLIKLAMENTRGGYKKIQQLLKLGLCLGIEDVDVQKMESLVLDMVGDAALAEADMKFCVQICQNIMAKGYQTGWKVFTQLAKFQCDPPIIDNEMRLVLISYALNMCPEDQIFQVLNSKYLIEIRTLQNRLTELSPNNSAVEAAILENQEEDSIVQGTLNKIKFQEFVHTTTKWINPLKEMAKVVTTGSAGVLLKGAQSLKHSSLESRAEKPLIGSTEEDTNADFIKEPYPAFYISEEEQFSRFIHPSILSFKYDSFSNASTAIYTHAHPALELCIALNRIWHLEKLLLGTEEAGLLDENVLEQLVLEILPEDLPWGLTILKTIENADTFSNVISKLPNSPVALTIILYSLSLKINSENKSNDETENIYTINPNKLISDTDEMISNGLDASSSGDSNLGKLISLFKDYKERLVGFKKSRNYLEMELELLGKQNRGKVSRMKNLVNLAFASETVDELDLVHSTGRKELFTKLVSKAGNMEEFSCLIELLRSAWIDGFATSAKENEWVLLLTGMIKTQEGIIHEEIISVLKQLEEESKMLDSNCFFQIMKEAQRCGANMLYVRLGLLSKETNLQIRGATMIRKCEFEVDELDEEVLYLIFKRGLLPGFLKKRQFYDDMIAFLAEHQSDKSRSWPTIDVVAEQLKSSGNVKEAQDLLNKHGGLLTGFKSALNLTASWSGWGKGSEQ